MALRQEFVGLTPDKLDAHSKRIQVQESYMRRIDSLSLRLEADEAQVSQINRSQQSSHDPSHNRPRSDKRSIPTPNPPRGCETCVIKMGNCYPALVVVGHLIEGLYDHDGVPDFQLEHGKSRNGFFLYLKTLMIPDLFHRWSQGVRSDLISPSHVSQRILGPLLVQPHLISLR